MEFKNIDFNILHCLDEKHRERRDKQVGLRLESVYKAFADIPARNVSDAITSLQRRGLLEVAADGRKLSLTPAGVDANRKIRQRLQSLQGSGS